MAAPAVVMSGAEVLIPGPKLRTDLTGARGRVKYPAATASNVDRSLARWISAGPNADSSRAELISAGPNVDRSRAELISAGPNVDRSRAELISAGPNVDRSRAELISAGPNVDRSRAELISADPNVDSSRGELISAGPNADRSRAELISAGPNVDRSRAELISAGPNVDRSQGELINAGPNVDKPRGELINAGPNVDKSRGELIRTDSNVDKSPAELIRTDSNVDKAPAELFRTGSNVDRSSADLMGVGPNVDRSQGDMTAVGAAGGGEVEPGPAGGGAPSRDAMCASLEREFVHDVYEEMAHHFADVRYKAWPRVNQFLQELQPGALVADVGCGSGKYLGVNPEVMTLGSDRCERLAGLAAERGYDVMVCDNLNLPYRDVSFDAVVSIGVIHHMTTPTRRAQAVSELARVARPGGRIMIYVWAMEQKHRKFKSQDVLVPWHLKTKHKKGKPGKTTNRKSVQSSADGGIVGDSYTKMAGEDTAVCCDGLPASQGGCRVTADDVLQPRDTTAGESYIDNKPPEPKTPRKNEFFSNPFAMNGIFRKPWTTRAKSVSPPTVSNALAVSQKYHYPGCPQQRSLEASGTEPENLFPDSRRASDSGTSAADPEETTTESGATKKSLPYLLKLKLLSLLGSGGLTTSLDKPSDPSVTASSPGNSAVTASSPGNSAVTATSPGHSAVQASSRARTKREYKTLVKQLMKKEEDLVVGPNLDDCIPMSMALEGFAIREFPQSSAKKIDRKSGVANETAEREEEEGGEGNNAGNGSQPRCHGDVAGSQSTTENGTSDVVTSLASAEERNPCIEVSHNAQHTVSCSCLLKGIICTLACGRSPRGPTTSTSASCGPAARSSQLTGDAKDGPLAGATLKGDFNSPDARYFTVLGPDIGISEEYSGAIREGCGSHRCGINRSGVSCHGDSFDCTPNHSHISASQLRSPDRDEVRAGVAHTDPGSVDPEGPGTPTRRDTEPDWVKTTARAIRAVQSKMARRPQCRRDSGSARQSPTSGSASRRMCSHVTSGRDSRRGVLDAESNQIAPTPSSRSQQDSNNQMTSSTSNRLQLKLSSGSFRRRTYSGSSSISSVSSVSSNDESDTDASDMEDLSTCSLCHDPGNDDPFDDEGVHPEVLLPHGLNSGCNNKYISIVPSKKDKAFDSIEHAVLGIKHAAAFLDPQDQGKAFDSITPRFAHNTDDGAATDMTNNNTSYASIEPRFTNGVCNVQRDCSDTIHPIKARSDHQHCYSGTALVSSSTPSQATKLHIHKDGGSLCNGDNRLIKTSDVNIANPSLDDDDDDVIMNDHRGPATDALGDDVNNQSLKPKTDRGLLPRGPDAITSPGGATSVGSCKRFYHVFREGELVELIEERVPCLKVLNSYYDHANWCVIAEKRDGSSDCK